MCKEKGFTLVEMLIVIAILACVAVRNTPKQELRQESYAANTGEIVITPAILKLQKESTRNVLGEIELELDDTFLAVR